MKKWLFSAAVLGISSLGFAQKISYSISFPNIIHHEARIEMEVSGTTLSALNFRMSRSSPGRYATHEFGKNVYDLQATDASGKSISIKRTEGDVWQLSDFKAPVKLTYTLYANYADGTYAGVDPTSIHLNMPAAFMWVKELQEVPVSVKFNLPDTGFTIATQLKPTNDKTSFTAPNLQYLMDSPTKIGKLQWRKWPISNGATQMTMQLALEADARETQVDSLAQTIQKIAAQAKAVFGEYPVFDNGTYTFIASINPYVYGDGMEHRNSTMITSGRQLSLLPRALGVFSHEFFHCWNVERIRPQTLEPFNFEHSNISNELWCAEGFTQYYGQLLMVRAGLVPDTSYAADATELVGAKLNTPGAAGYTPIEASNEAVFVDAGVAVDKTNYGNISTSYYSYGGAIALALDLTLRKQGKTLDQFMQQMWKVHGKPEKPYTVADMQAALSSITSTAFAKEFFDKYVYAPGKPDYESLLSQAGFTLKKAAPGKAWMGRAQWIVQEGYLVIASNTIRNTPLYDAGLDVGDAILNIDGKVVGKETDLYNLLSRHKPGDEITIAYWHRGLELKTKVKLTENPALVVATYESMSQPVTNAMKAFRKSWLGAK